MGSTFRIGLTGGVGSGKSRVASLFAALGVPVIDADVIAREHTAPGSEGLREIVDTFGEEILGSDGTLRRDLLRRRIFEHPVERRLLENLLHPRIRASMDQRAGCVRDPYCILVIPLLVESGQRDLVQRVLVVDAPTPVQIERIMRRDGMSEAETRRILAAQTSREARLAAADDVMDNGAEGASDLETRVAALHQQYLVLAHGHR